MLGDFQLRSIIVEKECVYRFRQARETKLLLAKFGVDTAEDYHWKYEIEVESVCRRYLEPSGLLHDRQDRAVLVRGQRVPTCARKAPREAPAFRNPENLLGVSKIREVDHSKVPVSDRSSSSVHVHVSSIRPKRAQSLRV